VAVTPDSRWAYSNAGFVVLGAVIERISGQSYFDYVRQHIYRPAGMRNSDSWELTEVVPNLAVGYLRVEGDDAFGMEERRSSAHCLAKGATTQVRSGSGSTFEAVGFASWPSGHCSLSLATMALAFAVDS
jgi:CubicO group peptidase (beta-lactamase class C family)